MDRRALRRLLTIAALVGAMTIVPITYQAEGEIILLVPTDNLDESVVAQNAYLGFGGSLNVVTFVLARAAGGQQAATEIEAAGGVADFIVDLVPGDAPMLSITATSKDPAEAMKTYERVLAPTSRRTSPHARTASRHRAGCGSSRSRCGPRSSPRRRLAA